jgi:predicted CoA-binding protein
MGKTVVIGASENTDRYSNRAVRSLTQHNEPVVAVGLRTGKIGGVEIMSGFPVIEDVETVTLYMGPQNQPSWYVPRMLNSKRCVQMRELKLLKRVHS